MWYCIDFIFQGKSIHSIEPQKMNEPQKMKITVVRIRTGQTGVSRARSETMYLRGNKSFYTAYRYINVVCFALRGLSGRHVYEFGT